jgi:hypothetical protein
MRVSDLFTRHPARAALFVPADKVLDWGPHTVRIAGRGADLPTLAEQVLV